MTQGTKPKRLYESGALVSYEHDKPGEVCVLLTYDRPGLHTRLHHHPFGHWMDCVVGAARVLLEGVETILREGGTVFVPKGAGHSVVPLQSGTVLRCRHDIRKANGELWPDAFNAEGIPLEWLKPLTVSEAA